MWRNVLAVLALCCFACAVPACSAGAPKGDGAKPVENKPGSNPKTGEKSTETKDTTKNTVAE